MDNAHRPGFNFLSNGGEMGALMRETDWSATALGPVAAWPPLLKSMVRMMLSSKQPMLLWWGPELVQFYNDACRQTVVAGRHPSALGQPGRACWNDIWPSIGSQIETVMAGGGGASDGDRLATLPGNATSPDAWWACDYSPVEDEAGVQGVLAVCSDLAAAREVRAELDKLERALTEQISQREQAERLEAIEAAQRLQAEQALLAQRQAESAHMRAMFEQAPGFMCILRGPDHVVEFANQAFERFVGARDLIGKPLRAALPELAGQGFFALLDSVYGGGRPFTASDVTLMLRKCPDGPLAQVSCDFVCQPSFNGGEVSGIFVEGFDATERTLAKQALERSELRLREGMKVARMVVWDWILDTNEVIFSDNASELFGANWSSMTQVWRAIPAEDLRRMGAARRGALARNGTYGEVIRLTRPDNGELIWLQVYGTVVADAGGVPRWIRGVSIDVTARKRAEESLREASRHKDEFLAMLSHELRNPLAPIRSAAHLLGMAPADIARVKQSSIIIERQVNHMTSLINDLLDVSRVNTGLVALEKNELDMHQVVIESLEQTQPLMLARGHELSVRAPGEGEVAVWGDRKRLVQVVTNLLHNAAKYTPERGSVSLEIVAHPAVVEIHVSDNGIGIGSDLLPHVFELFTQQKRTPDRSQGGLGLGLALVKSLVSLHGGYVTVVSEGAGTGSVFSIYLPRHLEENPWCAEAPAPARCGMRVLVVDDNEDAANAMAMLLRMAGHTVQVECDPLRALDRAIDFAAHACLLDIGMPGMDGTELARRMRAALGDTLLVAITGYGRKYDRDSALAAGFDHYFVKPARTAELLDVLAAIVPAARMVA